ncbi:hypothetical protein [Sinomicrobium oceani]|nr:hypothetical protein [Sinomicrobium oceani]
MQRHILNRKLYQLFKAEQLEGFHDALKLLAQKIDWYVTAHSTDEEETTRIIQEIFIRLWMNRQHLEYDTFENTIHAVTYKVTLQFFENPEDALR